MFKREAALVGGAGKEPVRYSWDERGFYAVLKARVKKYFLEKHGQGGVDPDKASVNRFIKVSRSKTNGRRGGGGGTRACLIRGCRDQKA